MCDDQQLVPLKLDLPVEESQKCFLESSQFEVQAIVISLPVRRLPLGILAWAVIFFWLTGCNAIACMSFASTLPMEGVAGIPKMIQSSLLSMLFMSLAIGYLNGQLWSWWYAMSNGILMIYLLPVMIANSFLDDDRSLRMNMIYVAYWVIAMLVVRGLREAEVLAFFKVRELGTARSSAMVALVASFELLMFYGPTWLIEAWLYHLAS